MIFLLNFRILYCVSKGSPETMNIDFVFSDFMSNWISSKNWENNSVDQIGSTISGIYSMLLVCIHVAFAFTELVKYPDLDVYLERHGFFLYLFLGSNFYFIYIFICISRARK